MKTTNSQRKPVALLQHSPSNASRRKLQQIQWLPGFLVASVSASHPQPSRAATGHRSATRAQLPRDLARNDGRREIPRGHHEADGSVHRRSLQKSHAVASACESLPGLLTGVLSSSPRHAEAMGQ